MAFPCGSWAKAPCGRHWNRPPSGRTSCSWGTLARTEVLAEMGRAFGLVFPSRWYETFGLTYIEALAAGLPTLAFPPNVVADAVERDDSGVIATWDGLEPALETATERFGRLRPHCRELFAARYGEAAFVERRLRLYEELVG